MGIIYNETRNKPQFFTPYHKMNATQGYLTHYGNFLYLRFIETNTLATKAEQRQASREILIAERKMTWWQKHPNYDQLEVTEGKRKLHNQWHINM